MACLAGSEVNIQQLVMLVSWEHESKDSVGKTLEKKEESMEKKIHLKRNCEKEIKDTKWGRKEWRFKDRKL